MNNINLIKANTNDISNIYDLAERIWNEHYTPIIGSEQVKYMLSMMYSKDSLTDQMQNKGHNFYLVKNADNENIGFISISGGDEKFIHKFYIDNTKQNSGLGSIVFNEIKEMHPDAVSYSLTVNRQNYKAINFYFKNGFKIDSVEDFDIGDGYYMNDFIMKWQS